MTHRQQMLALLAAFLIIANILLQLNTPVSQTILIAGAIVLFGFVVYSGFKPKQQ